MSIHLKAAGMNLGHGPTKDGLMVPPSLDADRVQREMAVRHVKVTSSFTYLGSRLTPNPLSDVKARIAEALLARVYAAQFFSPRHVTGEKLHDLLFAHVRTKLLPWIWAAEKTHHGDTLQIRKDLAAILAWLGGGSCYSALLAFSPYPGERATNIDQLKAILEEARNIYLAPPNWSTLQKYSHHRIGDLLTAWQSNAAAFDIAEAL